MSTFIISGGTAGVISLHCIPNSQSKEPATAPGVFDSIASFMKNRFTDL